MKATLTAAVAALTLAAPCFAADDINQLQLLSQAQFRDLSEDLGAALSYKPVSPAEPLGLTGFDIGLEATATELRHNEVWDIASSGSAPGTVVTPKLHLIKGLPLNIDVGALYSKIPGTNVSYWGGELRYAVIGGGLAMPAVAIRGTYTKMSGVDQLDFSTKGLELTASKGFAMLTPYAGLGEVWVDSHPSAVTGLTDENFTQTKYYLGADINFAVMNFALEYDNTDSVNSYSAKLGWRF
jgi:hypothetical protein